MMKVWDLRKKLNAVIPSSLPIDDDDDSLYEEGDTEEDGDDSVLSADSAVVLNRASPNPTTPEEDTPPSTIPITPPEKPASPTDKNTVIINTPTTKQRPRSVSDSNYKPAASHLQYTKQKVSPLRHQTVITPTIKKTRVCPCTVKGEQYSHIALNETYTGSVQAMFRLLFDSSFFPGFLERYENFEHVRSGVWKHGKRDVVGQRRIKSSTSGYYFKITITNWSL